MATSMTHCLYENLSEMMEQAIELLRNDVMPENGQDHAYSGKCERLCEELGDLLHWLPDTFEEKEEE